MRGSVFFAVLGVAAGVALLACKSEAPPPQQGPRVVSLIQPKPAATQERAAGAAGGGGAAAAPTALPRRPWEEQVLSFPSRDGLRLGASFYAQDPSSPVLIAAHRLGGQRGEWGALLARLSETGASVLLLDLRGHGESAAPAPGHEGGGLERADVEATEGDVLAAVAEVDRKLGRRASALVGLGSDLGATALVLAARREPRFVALALVSPVAALRGVDLYGPFAAVRSRPALLMASKDDPVSGEPARTLASMVGTRITLRLYEGQAHGAPRLGAAAPAAWDDLWAWLGPTLIKAASLADEQVAAAAAAASASAEANAPGALEVPAASASGSAKGARPTPKGPLEAPKETGTKGAGAKGGKKRL